jgi:predicted GNAT family N-acyltransferase
MGSVSPDISVLELRDPAAATLEAIGRLRCSVWAAEGALNTAAFPEGVWIDAEDYRARHWVATTGTGTIVGAARLVRHDSLDTADRDVALWKACGRSIALPIADLGRLVVLEEYRGRGIASALNRVRIDAARSAGISMLITTASFINRRLLLRVGFSDIGETVSFDDRPGVIFYALEMRLNDPVARAASSSIATPS